MTTSIWLQMVRPLYNVHEVMKSFIHKLHLFHSFQGCCAEPILGFKMCRIPPKINCVYLTLLLNVRLNKEDKPCYYRSSWFITSYQTQFYPPSPSICATRPLLLRSEMKCLNMHVIKREVIIQTQHCIGIN